MCFRDTDTETHVICIILITWFSWTSHVIRIVIIWLCDLLYSCHDILARTCWTWSIIPSIFVIVLDTVDILIFYSDIPFVPYYVFMFLLLFLCTLASPVLTDLYIFLVPRSESRYRELIIEHIMVQSLLRWASFSYLTCLIQIWWMILFMIQYLIYLLLSLYFIVYVYMCAILLVID